MKRSLILITLVALFAAACGSDSAEIAETTAEEAPTVTVFRTPT